MDLRRSALVVHIDDIPTAAQDFEPNADWKPLRHHLGIGGFGANAFVARTTGPVVSEHVEATDSPSRHEELYFVARGSATFSVDGEEIDAPEGTFLFVRDPERSRGATAHEAGTVVLAFGAEPGAAFAVSDWERRRLG
jgi:quercetin dioxygenase-like cupin family protein